MAESVVIDAAVGSARRSAPTRNGGGADTGGAVAQLGRPHRSASNNSSTSSDILVAPGPATSTSPSVTSFVDHDGMETRPRVVARVDDDRIFVVQMKGYNNKRFFRRLVQGLPSRRIKPIRTDDEDVGRNHRGTYSKKYVREHPDIPWIHRGQGRYLPATEVAELSTLSKADAFTAGHPAPHLNNGVSASSSLKVNGQSFDRAQLSPDLPRGRAVGLRRRDSETVSPADDHSPHQGRTSRFGRRVQSVPTAETERRSSRVTAGQNLNYYADEYQEDPHDDTDLGSDMEQTYDKNYVDAHPNDRFYHTGNGWYKKGDRPKGHRYAKRRDSEGHAIRRTSDGQFVFEPNQTIHLSQLHLYPTVEFHHCGNGWYKPGGDDTGFRASTIVPPNSDHEYESEEDGDGTVDKAHTLRHPEIDWTHRGNGRYRRRSSAAVARSPKPHYSGRRNSRYDDELVDSSRSSAREKSEEKSERRAKSRFSHGSGAEPGSIGRRGTSLPIDDSTLYSKAYVKAHPEEIFHHRGQGRYARGPRPKPVADDASVDSETDEVDMEALVDTDFVEAHPEETFHHRGQGRWARGLPPPGSSNKVAIRGPGAKERLDFDKITGEDAESNKLPPLSALLLKTEGPDKYPYVNWYYRGGGKWARITKHDWEALQNNTHARAKPRSRPIRQSVAAMETRPRRDVDQEDLPEYPRKRRRRTYAYDEHLDDVQDVLPQHSPMKRHAVPSRPYGGMGKRTISKAESSEAPTPRPRVMTLEEDPLDDGDLPSLYKDGYSPSDSEAEDEAGRLLQATFSPMTRPDLLLKPLIKHDPRTRPTENLHKLSEWAHDILAQMQEEYLESDKITAPHARIPRRPVKGGRLPVDPQVFEDKKEADLYDYHYDPRKLGYQDPEHQRIHRDADGRELRGRRHRSTLPPGATLPGWDFGDDNVGSKRAVKPINRFDGIVDQPRKRGRHSTTANGTVPNSRTPSLTPDVRIPAPATISSAPAVREYVPQTKGRWAGHIPKRIQELRRESEGPTVQANKKHEPSPAGTVRKGRPPGSRNLHKRRDAGIKKGPRKPKVVDPDVGSISPASTTAAGAEQERWNEAVE